MLLNNQEITEEIKEAIKKYLEAGTPGSGGVSSLRLHGTAPEPEGRATSLRLPALEVPQRPKP